LAVVLMPAFLCVRPLRPLTDRLAQGSRAQAPAETHSVELQKGD
jgi:hypothetical protein